MRVFVRNKKTEEYFRTSDRWVKNQIEAFDFKQIERVVYAVSDFGLADVEMVMTDEDGNKMFSIDLSRAKAHAGFPVT